MPAHLLGTDTGRPLGVMSHKKHPFGTSTHTHMAISLVLAVAGSTCKPTSEIASWGNPKNEPCYAHDGGMCNGEPAGRGGLPSAASSIISPSLHTVGAYPVCCVTVGTCISVHGGMVSSTVCTLPPVPVPSSVPITRDCLDAFPFAARLV